MCGELGPSRIFTRMRYSRLCSAASTHPPFTDIHSSRTTNRSHQFTVVNTQKVYSLISTIVDLSQLSEKARTGEGSDTTDRHVLVVDRRRDSCRLFVSDLRGLCAGSTTLSWHGVLRTELLVLGTASRAAGFALHLLFPVRNSCRGPGLQSQRRSFRASLQTRSINVSRWSRYLGSGCCRPSMAYSGQRSSKCEAF